VTNEPYFLDANIFMYAAGAEHPYKAPCVEILARVEVGELQGIINTEILQEMLYRYSRLKLPQKGVQLCREILAYSLTILPVNEDDSRLAIDLFAKHHQNGLEARDAIHAAVMKNNGVRKLLSVDRDFDLLDFVTRVDPLTFEA
jgi:predicted nucleic acid-binding protein